MRSHMVNLPIPPKPEDPPPPPLVQLSFEAESASSSSSSSSEEEEDDKGLCYGLRENPKRSFRLVDPEFSFPVVESASVILQDRESETESSKNPTRTRSKRACNNNQFHHHPKKMKPSNDHHHNHHHHHHSKNKTEPSWVEPELLSSVSNATTEEDVAFCLMMLSRDKWKRQEVKDEEEDEEEEEAEDDEEDEEDDEGDRSVEDSEEFYDEMKSSKTRSSVRGRYKCETCKKAFRSYQALGGHRASHKKIKSVICEPEIEHENNAPMVAEKKIHECPVCFRVFASGQALGGHKRTHVTGSATPVRTPPTKFGDNNSLIDLNLPAPFEEDEISQIENSAVSDAEFLKPSSHIAGAQVA